MPLGTLTLLWPYVMVELGLAARWLHVILGLPLMNSQHFRYWIARLRPIAQPQAWMPLLGAGMVSGFVWVAYQNPESLSFAGAAPGGSEESAAIGADIDSVSVLMQEMGDRSVDEGEPDAVAKTQTDAKTQTNAKTQMTLKADGYPGSDALAQLLKFTPETLGADGMSHGISNGISHGMANHWSVGERPSRAGLNSATAQNTLFTRNDGLAARINPLAQAIDRLNAQQSGNQGGFGNQNGLNPVENRGGVPIEGTGLIGASPVWAGIPVNGTSALTTSAPPMSSGSGRSAAGGYDNNAYNTLTGAPAGIALPDPGIATPIAPIGVPIAPPAGLNSGMVTPFPASPTEPVSVPSEQVFSAPRPIPGRITGGGTINTFSNP